MADAAKVAALLAKDNESYAASNSHIAFDRQAYTENFLYPIYELHELPKKGEENFISLDSF